MRKILKNITAISILTTFISLTAAEKVQVYSKSICVKKDYSEPITVQQRKAQVSFFKDALDEFGAVSPEQVIELWAKARKTRNGVFMYSVLCDNLKNKLERLWGKAEESFWIIGGSSPWVDSYEITDKKKLKDGSYDVTIKFYWTTSGGSTPPTFDKLHIVKQKDRWCVSKAEGLDYYTK